MSRAIDYFARVAPILGSGLSQRTLAVNDITLTARIIELLAGCQLRRVVVPVQDAFPRWPFGLTVRWAPGREVLSGRDQLQAHLAWKNPFQPMVWLDGGSADVTIHARRVSSGGSARVQWCATDQTVTIELPVGDGWSYAQVSYWVSLKLRDHLSGRIPWPSETVVLGHPEWPFELSRSAAGSPERHRGDSLGGHVMVVGCGSVGSEAIRWLPSKEVRWTLVDGGTVSVFNPHRQWFGGRDIGRRKVEVLAEQLRPAAVRAVPQHLSSNAPRSWANLIDRDPPDLVLLTTGARRDAGLSELLWQRGIPHVVAYAYPRAHYFEVTCVIPSEQTPCASCLTGHLYSGPEPPSLLDDELSRFLYRPVTEAERAQLYRDLVAEPATPIDTARVADVVALCAREMLVSAVARRPWFARMLRHQTTCLLGGNVAQRQGEQWSYGISFPGQVVRLGPDDIVGVNRGRACPTCDRRWAAPEATSVSGATGAEIDRALLS